MNTLSSLSRKAQEATWDGMAPEGYVKDNLGFTIPADGWSGRVQITDVKFDTTASGNPSIGLFCLTAENISFWTNLFTSSNDQANKITFRQLEALGVSQEFLDTDPSQDEIVKAILNTEVVNVRIRHQESDMIEGRVFLRPSFYQNAVTDDLESLEFEVLD